jgi:cell division protein FtsB
VRVSGVQVIGGLMVLAIVAVATSVVFGAHGVTHLMRLRTERRELGETAFALLERARQLRGDITRLRTDDRALEALARRQLGLVRPDETVYRLRRPAH